MKRFEVQIGMYDRKLSFLHTTFHVKKAIVHPNYNLKDKASQDDIAILKLNEPVKMLLYQIMPICLPISNFTWILLSNISPWGTMKFKDVSGSSVVGVLVFRTSGRLESGKIILISGTILPDPSLFEQICNGLLKILSIVNILNNV